MQSCFLRPGDSPSRLSSRSNHQDTVNMSFIYCILWGCMKSFLSRSTHHGPCRLQEFPDTTQSPCPDCPNWDKGKTSKCQDTASSPNFKIESSRYSKYELYLLYLVGVRVNTFFSFPVRVFGSVFRLGVPARGFVPFRALFPVDFFRFFPEAVLKKRRGDGIVRKRPAKGGTKPLRTRNHSPETP